MKGYCSNSPIRCSVASSGEIITSEDHCCPKCLKSLIVVDVKLKDIEKIHVTLKSFIFIAALIFVATLIILFFISLYGYLL